MSEVPFPPIVFVWGGLAIFLGSKSGHIQSVKLLQNMASNRTQHPPTPPPPCQTPSVMYFDTRKGGVGEGGELNREKARGATVHKAG
jgi:hypothetical protein